jgi:hypothetical protein
MPETVLKIGIATRLKPEKASKAGILALDTSIQIKYDSHAGV